MQKFPKLVQSYSVPNCLFIGACYSGNLRWLWARSLLLGTYARSYVSICQDVDWKNGLGHARRVEVVIMMVELATGPQNTHKHHLLYSFNGSQVEHSKFRADRFPKYTIVNVS